MKIVVDTNVVISGLFFGGFPQRILSAIVNRKGIFAYATCDIVEEYREVVRELVDRKQGHLNEALLTPLIEAIEIVQPVTEVQLSRDPDDDKFIGCAIDAKALYIVSGDADLLVLEKVGNVEIITARSFCERFL